jgi:hypothetical protein
LQRGKIITISLSNIQNGPEQKLKGPKERRDREGT